jgi:hypothetical protein
MRQGKRWVLLVVCCFLALAGKGWAQPIGNVLDAGGLEFGGELHISYLPLLFISDGESREQWNGDHILIVDGSAGVGFFPADRFSLQFKPGILFLRNQWNNGDRVDNILMIDLALGADYYLRSKSNLFFSIGGDLSLGISPGVDGKEDGDTAVDDSFALTFGVNPRINAYYMVSDRVAPFLSVSTKFRNRREMTSYDGSPYEYEKGFMNYWQMLLHVNVGVKYFLPQGARQMERRQRYSPDILTNLD